MEPRKQKRALFLTKLPHPSKAVLAIMWCVCFLLVFLVCFEISVRVMVRRMAEVQGLTLAADAMNYAVNQSGSQVQYDARVSIEKDSLGNITMVKINGYEVNQLATEMTDLCEKKLMGGEVSLSVPLGAVMGSQIFSSKGPIIKMAAEPYAQVNADIASEFISTGINQTRHRIIATIEIYLRYTLPGQSVEVEYKNSMPLYETVIVGQVPNTYLKTGSQEDLLYLVP